MQLFGKTVLLLGLLAALFQAGFGLLAAYKRDDKSAGLLEKLHLAQTALLLVASGILTYALVKPDFSFAYVHDYSDRVLPLFYKVTAFWAGQAGSLLFWCLCTAFFGALFLVSPGYKSVSERTKVHFWIFYGTVMAFFFLIMTSWTGPFEIMRPTPQDGRGLNPLLQNPGMIFHPPLLFLGYAGFTVPACLALGLALSGQSGLVADRFGWIKATRNYSVVSWSFLTAGIILGGWWSYMELGWGGYWAWDPVENASLIPWFAGTAFLHTAVIGAKRGMLHRTNIFLVTLTLVTSFLATYLVRSGVVDSLHAFGDSGVGLPLLIFLLASTGVGLWLALIDRDKKAEHLGELASREGFLAMTVWVLLLLGLVVLLATLWPVISKLWSTQKVGLDQSFYNKVCLPFFVILSSMLMICPWLAWKGGLRSKGALTTTVGLFCVAAGFLWGMGYKHLLAVIGAASGAALVVGVVMLLVLDKSARTFRPSLAAWCVHLGLGLVVLGTAISGPFQVEKQVTLKPGERFELGGYTFTHKGIEFGQTEAFGFARGQIEVEKGGKPVGELKPERRQYAKFPEKFAEVDTIFSLGEELYISLLAAAEDKTAVVKASIHPLVNWIWIGSTIMCLAPFIGIRRFAKPAAKTEKAQ